MKNKVSLANAGYALFLLFFALEPLLGKWDAYWYALCGLAVVLGVVLVEDIVGIFRHTLRLKIPKMRATHTTPKPTPKPTTACR